MADVGSVELKLFHGTDSPFESFDAAKSPTGALWLADCFPVAQTYGNRVIEFEVTLNKPATEDDALAAARAVGVDEETLSDEYPLKILEQYPEALTWLRRQGFDAVRGNDTILNGEQDVPAVLLLLGDTIRSIRLLPSLREEPAHEQPMRYYEHLKEEPVFKAFVDSRRWLSDVAILNKDDCYGPGMAYLDDLVISRTMIDGKPAWHLVLGNQEYVGPLYDLETHLFSFAVTERDVPGVALDDAERARLDALAEQAYVRRMEAEREVIAEAADENVVSRKRRHHPSL